MPARRLAIFGLLNDLHALVVAQQLRAQGATVHVVEVDHLAHSGGLQWQPGQPADCRLRDRDGSWFAPAELDTLWWRRAVPRQRDHPGLADPAVADLVHREWEQAVLGCLLTSFTGWWVSAPLAQRQAQNKLWQLQCAQQLGLKLPPTLVSQDPQAIRAFAAAHAPLIVKAVKGSRQLSLDTVPFDPAQTDDASMQLSPAIYQARVAGQRHLRINAFGQQTIAIAIDAQDLDWRRNLNVPLSEVQLPPALAGTLQALRRRLGLEMAVFDGKIDADGDFVFFEANPQGQFLFAQPLAGVDLAELFASFLLAGPAGSAPTAEATPMRA